MFGSKYRAILFQLLQIQLCWGQSDPSLSPDLPAAFMPGEMVHTPSLALCWSPVRLFSWLLDFLFIAPGY